MKNVRVIVLTDLETSVYRGYDLSAYRQLFFFADTADGAVLRPVLFLRRSYRLIKIDSDLFMRHRALCTLGTL